MQRRGKQREGRESLPWILILPSKAEDSEELETDDSRDAVMCGNKIGQVNQIVVLCTF